MTQTTPATAVLGPGKTGLTIGLTVLNLDGTTYAAFSATGVAETSVAGTYRKAGGVVCPDAGAYLVWGVSGTAYAEATVESTAANVTLWKDATAPAMTGDAFARLGAPAGASVSADIAAVKADTAAIRVDTSETLPALLANVGAEVTVVSAVSGGDVTVYANDTWRFTVSDATLALTGYEVLALVVKRTPRQDDSEALLYLRSGAAGLVRINGAAPDNAANGSLASTATSFTGLVAISETAGIAEGKYLWWLKGFDTTPTPNEGLTLAVGTFTVTQPGLQAIA